MKTWEPRAPSPTNAIESATAATPLKAAATSGVSKDSLRIEITESWEGVASAKPPPIKQANLSVESLGDSQGYAQFLDGCVHDKGQLVDGLRRPAELARFGKIKQKNQNRPAPFAPPHFDVCPQSSLGADHGINPGGLQKLLQVSQCLGPPPDHAVGLHRASQVYGEHRGQIGGGNLFANEHASLRITNHVVPQK